MRIISMKHTRKNASCYRYSRSKGYVHSASEILVNAME